LIESRVFRGVKNKEQERREGCFVDWPGGRSTALRLVDPLAT
jgi:hypothetical protein